MDTDDIPQRADAMMSNLRTSLVTYNLSIHNSLIDKWKTSHYILKNGDIKKRHQKQSLMESYPPSNREAVLRKYHTQYSLPTYYGSRENVIQAKNALQRMGHKPRKDGGQAGATDNIEGSYSHGRHIQPPLHYRTTRLIVNNIPKSQLRPGILKPIEAGRQKNKDTLKVTILTPKYTLDNRGAKTSLEGEDLVTISANSGTDGKVLPEGSPVTLPSTQNSSPVRKTEISPVQVRSIVKFRQGMKPKVCMSL